MNKFEKFLEKKAISYRKLSKEIGINHVTISNHARGLSPMSMGSVKKYSEFFNMTVKEFMNKFVL